MVRKKDRKFKGYIMMIKIEEVEKIRKQEREKRREYEKI